MNLTKLRKVVTDPDTELILSLPVNTRVLVLSSPSNFQIRASLVQGDVLGDEEGWVVDRSNPRRVELNGVNGPLYFASTEPGPILDVWAWHE